MSNPLDPHAPPAGDPAAGPAVDAQGDLERVQHKVDAARTVLLRLLQEVVVAESRLNNNQAAQMLEANEQLVVAAMRDQADAQTAARSAEIDPLTNLPNRTLLLDRFAQAIAVAKRRATHLALLFLDLDNFKHVNDTLGLGAGDEALQEVARRLSHAVREADTPFVPLRVGGQDVQLTASIGISLYPDDGDSIDALIGQADSAMYRAKSRGPGTFALSGDAPLRPPAVAPAAMTTHEQALAAHERRHAQLQEANEQLVLAALGAQELQAAAERARQRQADFMAAVIEELGNPFAPIRVAAAMLGRAPGNETLLPRVQAIVQEQAARVSRLVAAANTRSGTAGLLQPADQQVCDLATVIDAAVLGLRGLLDLRQQKLTSAVPGGPIAVRGDAERVGHVLSNLLDNASKYTPDNGTIRLDVSVQSDIIVLTVSDDGIGITPDAVPRIFEPFGQDSRAIGFHGTSTGVGLPVVRALVTELGGTVVADSAGNGRGSRFVVTLPKASAGTADAPGAGHA